MPSSCSLFSILSTCCLSLCGGDYFPRWFNTSSVPVVPVPPILMASPSRIPTRLSSLLDRFVPSIFLPYLARSIRISAPVKSRQRANCRDRTGAETRTKIAIFLFFSCFFLVKCTYRNFYYVFYFDTRGVNCILTVVSLYLTVVVGLVF